MTPEDKKRDRYYLERFGITLARYDEMANRYEGCCWVCRNPPINNRLSVEHCHQWRYVKIKTWKLPSGGWGAGAEYNGQYYPAQEDKKNKAIREVRKNLQRASVRGTVCFPCNSAIRAIRNNATFAQNMADYLKEHQTCPIK